MGLLFRSFGKEPGGATDFVNGVIVTCELIGKIFLNLLKMIIVPLVVSSVIVGITSLHGVKGFGRLLSKTAGFYALTSLLAICLGLVLVNLIQPGLVNGDPNEEIRAAFDQHEASESEKMKVAEAKVSGTEQAGFFEQLSGFFLRMVPTNVVSAAAQNGQMLGLIFFSLLFAITMTRLPLPKIAPLRELLISLNEVMIKLTQGIWMAPRSMNALR